MDWIVINIGCIECGVSSGVVGVFGEVEAKEIAARLNNDRSAAWREGGQNSYEAYPMPSRGEVASEYQEWLKTTV